MDCRRGDAGGVEIEEEREERPGDIRGEAVEVDDEGVAGGVGIVSLGFWRSDVGVVVEGDELVEDRSALREEGDEEPGFGITEFPGFKGSMAV